MVLDKLGRFIYEFDYSRKKQVNDLEFDEIVEMLLTANIEERCEIFESLNDEIKQKVDAMVEGGLILFEAPAKKFKKNYKIGDEVKVDAQRQVIYANPKHVDAMKETKMTLIIGEPLSSGMGWLVKVKGKYNKVPQTGGKIPKSMRFSLNPDRLDVGTLSTSYPKPLRYLVTPA